MERIQRWSNMPICTACGALYETKDNAYEPPKHCKICEVRWIFCASEIACLYFMNFTYVAQESFLTNIVLALRRIQDSSCQRAVSRGPPSRSCTKANSETCLHPIRMTSALLPSGLSQASASGSDASLFVLQQAMCCGTALH